MPILSVPKSQTFNFKSIKVKDSNGDFKKKFVDEVDSQGSPILNPDGSVKQKQVFGPKGEIIYDMIPSRKAFALNIPYPTLESIISDGDAADHALLQSVIDSLIYDKAKELVDEQKEVKSVGPDGKEIVSYVPSYDETNFPYDKVDWHFIATLPPAQRSRGIPSIVREGFYADYLVTMLPVVAELKASTPEKVKPLVEAQIANFKIRLNDWKDTTSPQNRARLTYITELLGKYLEASEKTSEFEVVVTDLVERATQWLDATPTDPLAGI